MNMNYMLYDTPNSQDMNEIYHLRVLSWLSSGYIKKENFPDGWSDNLDRTAKIWAVKYNNNIIASGRVNILNDFETIKFKRIFEIFEKKQIKINFPIAFFSKLVVHPDHQKKGLSKMIDQHRIEYSIKRKSKSIILTTDKVWRANSLEKKGWEIIGRINPELDENWLLGNSFITLKRLDG